ncbi:MerR family transcriptional regulator [Virgibacillus chiguensis]|uniref:DNA-binding transcriptional regulator, MerR family n=1 Tax=Virgibacillus chiguensis TaxID=411959 RepID=A0A1M5RG42_9BACI|nr:MerR family transcriptional regulator [Virgibacillus chiguensis]SHH25224.1 DNA-binding transcriptional regulator, MerR family [Virgibacillus chiguensis]
MISIKEITKQTGITVRTMRYYDQINLLSPADKTEGGHRLYGEKELIKLQEIQFLKTLGFSLQAIKDMLENENHDWFSGLQNQLNYILKEKEKLGEMESILRGLLHEMVLEEQIDLLQLQKLIQIYQKDFHKREAYLKQMFDQEERKLLDMLPNINHGDPDTMEWIALMAQLKQHMLKGVSAPEVQRIIRRMDEKTVEVYGDCPEFIDKLWEIRKSPEKSQEAGFYPVDQELLEFVEKAFVIFQNNRKEA